MKRLSSNEASNGRLFYNGIPSRLSYEALKVSYWGKSNFDMKHKKLLKEHYLDIEGE